MGFFFTILYVVSYHMLPAARSEDWKEMFQNALSLSSEIRTISITKTTSSSRDLCDNTWPAKPEKAMYFSDINQKAAFILKNETKLIISFSEAK